MDWTEVISALLAAGYTQQQLAEACDCGQATVSDLARGVTKNPHFSTAQALLSLLKKTKAKQKARA